MKTDAILNAICFLKVCLNRVERGCVADLQMLLWLKLHLIMIWNNEKQVDNIKEKIIVYCQQSTGLVFQSPL